MIAWAKNWWLKALGGLKLSMDFKGGVFIC